ncbi:hypothetical protein KY285_024595 [Solanum tuberosum]|nr:hypothetical protein KY285_024595 [Solanum tuberosum]
MVYLGNKIPEDWPLAAVAPRRYGLDPLLPTPGYVHRAKRRPHSFILTTHCPPYEPLLFRRVGGAQKNLREGRFLLCPLLSKGQGIWKLSKVTKLADYARAEPRPGENSLCADWMRTRVINRWTGELRE